MLPRFDADQYFAQGGRASVGHTQAAGVPVTLENHKGDTRHRQDSGDSKMAADYGYIDTSRPDHDGMKTDAFVGPHKDSDRVFVVNQQHPRTGKFNEHKVLLGYKDRAHALRDYVHSFSDGLGHKRIHSVVEMGKHELKDWLKKDHSKPLKKAIGGPVTDPNDPNQWLQFGGQDMETAPAGLPIGQAVGTDVAYQTAEGLADAAKLAQEVQAGEVDPTSDEGIKRALGAAMVAQTGGVGGAPAGGAVLGSGMVRRAAESAAERDLSPLGLYSQAAEVAAALPQAKGSPQQMKAMLKGVKQEELAGFDEAFAGKKSVTKDEIAQHFRDQMPVVEERVLQSQNRYPYRTVSDWENAINQAQRRRDFDEVERLTLAWEESEGLGQQGSPKFQKYTLPGGENYREVLLKHEPNPSPISEQKYYDLANKAEREVLSDAEKDQMRAYTAWKNNDEKKSIPSFKSSHWDDPNVIAHLRMSDRTGPNGEKILHVEEIQSDWGQKGKKEGFLTPEKQAEYDRHMKELADLEKQSGELMRRASDMNNGNFVPYSEAVKMFPELEGISKRQAELVYSQPARPEGLPVAPYVTNTQAWTDLALKRALKEAAEGGYDKLVWTPGVEQAKRYDLAQHVNELYYSPTEKILYGKQKNGGEFRKEATPEKLPELIGKEVSEKLLNQPVEKSGYWSNHQKLSGVDLSVGGEGMKGYYDKIVPKRLQELIKKHDPSVKVGYTDVMLPPKGGAGHNNPPFEAPGISITPKMRESILKGRTAFAEGGEVEAPKPNPVEPEAYAEGGEVEPEAAAAPAPAASLDQKVDATVQDVAGLAQDGDIDQRKLAFLLRKASTGTMPADVSYTFAGEIMDHDTPALIDRFGRYPRSIRILSRVDAALGGEAGQSLGPVANEGGGRAGFAKGGKAEKKPYTGDKKAFEQFSQFALQNYGEQVGQNMINRAGGDAAKLMFAMAQYTKNLVAQDPSHADHHRQQIQQLGQLAYANKIDPRAAFNRTPDTTETRKELQDILKSDHKMNPAFKAALERMDKLVGSQ